MLDDDVIEIDVNYTPPVTGPKRTPVVIPISASYYSLLSCIEICFLYDIGDVNIVITNLTTSSSSAFSASSLIGNVSIPFNHSAGFFSIEFHTLAGVTYFGYLIL